MTPSATIRSALILGMAIVFQAQVARGEVLDRVAALVGREVITRTEVDNPLGTAAKTPGAEPAKRVAVLQALIDERLVAQGAMTEGFLVYDAEIESAIDLVCKQSGLTREALNQSLLDLRTTMEEYRSYIGRALLAERLRVKLRLADKQRAETERAPTHDDPGAKRRPAAPPGADVSATEDVLVAWTKEARAREHIDIKEERTPVVGRSVVVCSQAGVTSNTILRVELRGVTTIGKLNCNALRTVAGHGIDAALVRHDIRQLVSTGKVSDVVVEQDRGVVGFLVVEHPALDRVSLAPTGAIDSDLLAELKAALPRPGEPGSELVVLAHRRRLQQILTNAGFANARVDSIRATTKTGVAVTYQVDPGKATVVASFDATGNAALRTAELLSLAPSLKPGTVLNRTQVMSDLVRISGWYFDHGMIRAEVGSPVFAMQQDNASVAVTLNLREGDVFRIGKIAFRGGLAVPKAQYEEACPLERGAIFSRSVVQKTKECLEVARGIADRKQGTVEVFLETDASRHVVDITWQFASASQ